MQITEGTSPRREDAVIARVGYRSFRLAIMDVIKKSNGCVSFQVVETDYAVALLHACDAAVSALFFAYSGCFPLVLPMLQTGGILAESYR